MLVKQLCWTTMGISSPVLVFYKHTTLCRLAWFPDLPHSSYWLDSEELYGCSLGFYMEAAWEWDCVRAVWGWDCVRVVWGWDYIGAVWGWDCVRAVWGWDYIGAVWGWDYIHRSSLGMRLCQNSLRMRLYGSSLGMRLYGSSLGMRLCQDSLGMRLYRSSLGMRLYWNSLGMRLMHTHTHTPLSPIRRLWNMVLMWMQLTVKATHPFTCSAQRREKWIPFLTALQCWWGSSTL